MTQPDDHPSEQSSLGTPMKNAQVRELMQAAGKLAAVRIRPLEDGRLALCDECARMSMRAEKIAHAPACTVGRVFDALRALNEPEEEFFRVEGRPAEECYRG